MTRWQVHVDFHTSHVDDEKLRERISQLHKIYCTFIDLVDHIVSLLDDMFHSAELRLEYPRDVTYLHNVESGGTVEIAREYTFLNYPYRDVLRLAIYPNVRLCRIIHDLPESYMILRSGSVPLLMLPAYCAGDVRFVPVNNYGEEMLRTVEMIAQPYMNELCQIYSDLQYLYNNLFQLYGRFGEEPPMNMILSWIDKFWNVLSRLVETYDNMYRLLHLIR